VGGAEERGIPVCVRHIFVYFVVIALSVAGRTAITCDGCCSTKYVAVFMKWSTQYFLSQVQQHGIDQGVLDFIYLPQAFSPVGSRRLMVRTKIQPLTLADAIGHEILALDPNQDRGAFHSHVSRLSAGLLMTWLDFDSCLLGTALFAIASHFEFDVLACPGCGARMRILAAINPPQTIRKILACLGLPTRAPPVAAAIRDEEPAGEW
jgi:hypothetical protein